MAWDKHQNIPGRIDHKYTLREIDQMRVLVAALLNPVIWFSRTGGYSRTNADSIAHNADVEGRLRTYMLAGVRVSELEEAVKEQNIKNEAVRLSFPA